MSQTSRRGPPRARISKDLTRSAIPPILAVLALLLIGETAARLWWGAELYLAEEALVQKTGRGTTLSWDPRLLWRLPRGTWTDQGVNIRVNSLGMRSPEPKIPKPTGQRRVLGLGDSGIFGFGVDESAAYLSVAATVAGLEPFNAGVPGYSTHQAINWLDMAIDTVEPDVVVVSNMWGDKAIQGFSDRDLLATHTRIARHPLWLLNRLLDPLAVYRLLRYQVWKLRPPPPSGVLFQGQLPDDPNAAPRVPIEEYRDNLDTLASMAQEAGASLVFLLPSVSNDLDSDFEPPDLARYRDAMRQAGQTHSAAVVETPTILRASGNSATELFMDGIHLTVSGHAVVGQALGAVLAP